MQAYCHICVSDKSIEDFRILPCGHCFCDSCLRQVQSTTRRWNGTFPCPQCRAYCSQGDTHPIYLSPPHQTPLSTFAELTPQDIANDSVASSIRACQEAIYTLLDEDITEETLVEFRDGILDRLELIRESVDPTDAQPIVALRECMYLFATAMTHQLQHIQSLDMSLEAVEQQRDAFLEQFQTSRLMTMVRELTTENARESSRMKEEISQLETERANLVSELRDLRTDTDNRLQQLQGRVSFMQSELERTQDDLSASESTQTVLRAQIELLQGSLDAALSDVAGHRQRVEDATAQTDAFMEQIERVTALQSEISSLQRSHDVLEDQVNTLTVEQTDLRERNNTLENDIARQSAAAAARQRSDASIIENLKTELRAAKNSVIEQAAKIQEMSLQPPPSLPSTPHLQALPSSASLSVHSPLLSPILTPRARLHNILEMEGEGMGIPRPRSRLGAEFYTPRSQPRQTPTSTPTPRTAHLEVVDSTTASPYLRPGSVAKGKQRESSAASATDSPRPSDYPKAMMSVLRLESENNTLKSSEAALRAEVDRLRLQTSATNINTRLQAENRLLRAQVDEEKKNLVKYREKIVERDKAIQKYKDKLRALDDRRISRTPSASVT